MPQRMSSRADKSDVTKMVQYGMGAKVTIKNLLPGSLICYYLLLLFADSTEYHGIIMFKKKIAIFYYIFLLCCCCSLIKTMKLRVPYPYIILPMLVLRIRICCQNVRIHF
jgi:hypothetical protein